MKKFYMTIVAMLCGVAAMAQTGENKVTVADVAVKPGESGVLTIGVTNVDPFVRVQIKFNDVPGDIEISSKVKQFTMFTDRLNATDAYLAAGEDPDDPDSDLEDLFKFERLKNGTIMFASANAGYEDAAGFHNVAFLGNDGPLFTIPVTVKAGAEEKAYTITYDQLLVSTVSDPLESPTNLVNAPTGTFTFTVGEATGINSINADDSNAPIYNVAGQRVSKAQKGVFIQNGKKVAVK